MKKINYVFTGEILQETWEGLDALCALAERSLGVSEAVVVEHAPMRRADPATRAAKVIL